ncbi:hypothetical protein UCDDA912_g05121 [Diaporthe ampelina]|uniref:Ecp2 effector protein domain-containing protein n=1 Tax=Diaporthe ampelina TaxID=1214573 RepID=A0A0G2FLM5_9PEZI|nr:hypothetical protein UCDDA912_g05121 [Diaporthe ampelina]
MHLLSFLLFLMLPVSISAAVVDRIAYTPGSSEDTSNTLPELVRRENAITWWPDEEPQNACDADQDPQKTGGSQIFKWDCMAIQNFNNRSGRYTISGYYKQWAKINTMGSCTFAVSRDDDSTNDFE